MTSRYDTSLQIEKGYPDPYGVSHADFGINFSLYTHLATHVQLCLYSFDNKDIITEIPLDPEINKTGDVWHILIKGLPEKICYGYRLEKKTGRLFKSKFQKDVVILDPFAKAVDTDFKWGVADSNYHPLGLVMPSHDFDWEDDKIPKIPLKDLIIYEMHVRGLTRHESSGVKHPGSFLGMIEKIPYLKELGINALELMPIQEFNECEFKRYNLYTGKRLLNYWGYSPINFFAPMNRYASSYEYGQAVTEFKMLVKELHKNGIEVILDVVFNHTGEGNDQGPTYSFKGIDCSSYYMMDGNNFLNFSGCGNTVNTNHPITKNLIQSCLRYWVSEMHVDGFRFDLAAIFMREKKGKVTQLSSIIEEISEDPLLKDTKLIAEPWDAKDLYQLGGFYPLENRWSEWNDKYRDNVRRFIKGDRGVKRNFAIHLCGSDTIFPNRSPTASINFIISHDGFTLRDLVSYNYKRNSDNAEDNRDGHDNNLSWNCGNEGETENQKILDLRERQMKNFQVALMVSQGVPMLFMGDEYGHTRYGNNNSWCQDTEVNWFLWDKINACNYLRFYKKMIAFRKSHDALRMGRFLTENDIEWHSVNPSEPDWDGDTQMIAFTLKSPENAYWLYIAFNMHHTPLTINLPKPKTTSNWKMIVDTFNLSPDDYFDEELAPDIESDQVIMHPHSSIILKS